MRRNEKVEYSRVQFQSRRAGVWSDVVHLHMSVH